MHCLARLIDAASRAPSELTKVEVREFRELAYYAQHGFRVQVCPRGKRVYMVRDGRA